MCFETEFAAFHGGRVKLSASKSGVPLTLPARYGSAGSETDPQSERLFTNLRVDFERIRDGIKRVVIEVG